MNIGQWRRQCSYQQHSGLKTKEIKLNFVLRHGLVGNARIARCLGMVACLSYRGSLKIDTFAY